MFKGQKLKTQNRILLLSSGKSTMKLKSLPVCFVHSQSDTFLMSRGIPTAAAACVSFLGMDAAHSATQKLN